MVVKTEQDSHDIEEGECQDYTETKMVDPFEESADQDHDNSGTANISTDSKDLSQNSTGLNKSSSEVPSTNAGSSLFSADPLKKSFSTPPVEPMTVSIPKKTIETPPSTINLFGELKTPESSLF